MFIGDRPAPRLQMDTLRSRLSASLYPVLSITAASHMCLPWMHAKEAADLVPSRSRTASLRGCSPAAAALIRRLRTSPRVHPERFRDVLRRYTRSDTNHSDLVVAWHDLWTRSGRTGRLHVRMSKSSANTSPENTRGDVLACPLNLKYTPRRESEAAMQSLGVLSAAMAASRTVAPASLRCSRISCKTLDEKEEYVISAIRETLDAGRELKPRRAFDCLGRFGSATGILAQTWLTPQQCERVMYYWWGSWQLVLRDLQRGRIQMADVQATPLFLLLFSQTFPWTPLLIPLVVRAVGNASSSTGRGMHSSFVPSAFNERRILALQRLRGDGGLDIAGTPAEFRTPQDLDGGLRFFADGTSMVLRDMRRGRLFAYGDQGTTFGWFAFLAFSTFPLTPLLLPLIDKRRTNGAQSDYVPAAFRARRLAAYARQRALRQGPTRSAVDVLHAAAAACVAWPSQAATESQGTPANQGPSVGDARPPPAELLHAIVALSSSTPSSHREAFLERLAGGGSPGRRWRLMYVAGKEAMKAARAAQRARVTMDLEGDDEPRPGMVHVPHTSWLDEVGQAVLPWTWLKHGIYLDQYVSAVQRFDLEACENENGVFGLLGYEGLEFSVRGPFKWPQPEKRTVCAFEPMSARCRIGPLEWEWPLEVGAATASMWSTSSPEGSSRPEKVPFEEAKVNTLPFFRFLLVDERVAVAQGRSGSVAVWVATS